MNLQQAVKTLVLARAWMGICNWQYSKGKTEAANYAEHKSYTLHNSVPDAIYSDAISLLDNDE